MINGGIKFFEQSKTLFKDGAVATASSNDSLIKNILTNNNYVYWLSNSSTDEIEEVIEINFTKSAINRLLLIDHNFKEFSVKYDSNGILTDFSNVVNINNEALIAVSENNFSLDTAYYEFDEVQTDRIVISILKTQIANNEKTLERFIATKEIGTFSGFPTVTNESLSRNEIKQKVLSNKYNLQKQFETAEYQFKFRNYPYSSDYQIIESLYESEESFLLWLCGGKYGDDNFKIIRRGWYLKDLYSMAYLGKLNAKFEKGIYSIGFNAKIKLVLSV